MNRIMFFIIYILCIYIVKYSILCYPMVTLWLSYGYPMVKDAVLKSEVHREDFGDDERKTICDESLKHLTKEKSVKLGR